MVFSDLDTPLSKLQKCFKKCWKYGISLNSKKCAFMVILGMILCFIVSKEGKLLDPKKVKTIVKMPVQKNSHDIQVINNLAQFYQCFVKKIAFIMAPITIIMWKSKKFIWTQKCQDAWETTKQKYMEALILITPNWERELYVHTNASNLVVGSMLAQNLDGKCD
jgi:hypothetical protein